MILDRFRLDGKVALVAGAGRGIGAASALALAEAGADVALLARSADQLAATAEAARASGRRALTIPTDLMDADAVAAAVARTATELGRIDVVVSVVGGAMPGPFTASTDEAFRDSFERNVIQAARLVRLCLPHQLEAGGGTVVFVSSVIATVHGRGYAVYGAGKAALDHLTRMLAHDLAPRIRVNAVAPGAVMTDALSMIMTDDAIREDFVARTPLRRIGEPEEIAAAVLYLASPASSYTTGHVLQCNGGINAPNFDLRLPDL